MDKTTWTWMFVGCMTIALIYLRYAPKPRPIKSRIDHFLNFVLRWGHSFTWFFFALFTLSMMSGIAKLQKIGMLFALIGIIIYLIFIVVLIYNRHSYSQK